jgi:hypothetical protein
MTLRRWLVASAAKTRLVALNKPPRGVACIILLHHLTLEISVIVWYLMLSIIPTNSAIPAEQIQPQQNRFMIAFTSMKKMVAEISTSISTGPHIAHCKRVLYYSELYDGVSRCL